MNSIIKNINETYENEMSKKQKTKPEYIDFKKFKSYGLLCDSFFLGFDDQLFFVSNGIMKKQELQRSTTIIKRIPSYLWEAFIENSPLYDECLTMQQAVDIEKGLINPSFVQSDYEQYKERMELQLKEKDDEIKEQEKQINKKGKKISKLEDTIGSKDEEIQKLKEDIEKKDKRLKFREERKDTNKKPLFKNNFLEEGEHDIKVPSKGWKPE